MNELWQEWKDDGEVSPAKDSDAAGTPSGPSSFKRQKRYSEDNGNSNSTRLNAQNPRLPIRPAPSRYNNDRDSSAMIGDSYRPVPGRSDSRAQDTISFPLRASNGARNGSSFGRGRGQDLFPNRRVSQPVPTTNNKPMPISKSLAQYESSEDGERSEEDTRAPVFKFPPINHRHGGDGPQNKFGPPQYEPFLPPTFLNHSDKIWSTSAEEIAAKKMAAKKIAAEKIASGGFAAGDESAEASKSPEPIEFSATNESPAASASQAASESPRTGKYVASTASELESKSSNTALWRTFLKDSAPVSGKRKRSKYRGH